MSGYQPSLQAPAMSNVFDEEIFRLVATFGTASISSVFGKDVTLARNSTGNYTLTLPQPYRRITSISAIFQDATGATLSLVLVSETIATDGKAVFEARVAAGTATEPATGDKLFLSVGVTRNSANDRYVA